jgi:uncharacterized protein with HEPN domain
MQPDPRKYLWDALRAAERLGKFRQGKSFADYQSDDLLRSAVERQLEIIGEALNQLAKADPDLAAQIPELGRIVAFRNILIHGYAMVDDVIVWQVLTGRLPELAKVLGNLLAGTGDEDALADSEATPA